MKLQKVLMLDGIQVFISRIFQEKRLKWVLLWDFDLSYGNLNYSDAQYTSDFI